MSDNIAPEGKIWVCGACGKTTKDKYAGERGWDESCMLNAILCDPEKLVWKDGRVVQVLE
jgi:hypothetical protein